MKSEVKERISKLSERLVSREEGTTKEYDQSKENVTKYEPLKDRHKPTTSATVEQK